ncbi:MAG: ferrous iron transport protein B [Anaerolineae bacterium]
MARVRTVASARPSKIASALSCCDTPGVDVAALGVSTIRVALAGQPNVGKSTVFNILTGLSQHVGNWPGKTVERKAGVYDRGDTPILLVDLPGTYSLTANSEEERIARDYIIRERPDVVVLVADAASLERNLYLLAELLLLPVPIILALNMMDVAREQGLEINVVALSQALGLPVVPMAATKNEGIRELVAEIEALARDPSRFHAQRPQLRPDHRQTLAELLALVGEHVPEPYESDWVAVKLLEGDAEVTALAREWLPPELWQQVHAILLKHEDAILDIAGGRYEWIEALLRQAVAHRGLTQVTLTERLDRVATHPFWGILLLLAAAALMFFLVYAVGSPIQSFLDTYTVQVSATWLRSVLTGAPSWLVGLLTDGVFGGVGTMLTFAPILAIFFAALGLLEDTGYMARAAFIMDRFMHLIGLHGRSFLPLFLGFGCNVPAVMGARIVDSRRARLLNILLAPLVPCAARLGVLATLAAAFFGRQAFFVSIGLIAVNLMALALLGLILNRLLLRGEQMAFIMELPLYHRPNWRTIGLFVWRHLREFLRRAGTIILAASVIVWALSTLPHGDIGSSYLAIMGRALAPIGSRMGLGWQMMVALLASFVAKENSLATLAILYGASADGTGLAAVLVRAISPASALAFLAVQMLFIPCVATMAVIRQETGSWKWTLVDIGLLLAVSLLGGVIAYRLALAVGY